VKATNACGTSPVRTYSVTVITNPATPGVITGSASVCSGTVQTYSIAPVNNALYYFWGIPGGWTGTSTGTSITTTVGTTGGNISVIAVNDCGISPTTRILTVTVGAAPAQPGAITGNTSPCSGTHVNYSIAAVSGATSYTWVLPSGWSGSSTLTVIQTTVGTNSGYVKVKANSSCGSSSWDSVQVTVGVTPTAPGPITGPTQVCQGSNVTYSISAVAGATSYSWTYPGGWSGTSTTTSTSVTATVGTGTGNVSVRAVNSCGTSSPTNLAVTHVVIISITGNPASFNFCAQNTPTYEILMATNGFNAYAWSPSGGSAATATVSAVNTYTISATNNTYGCTAIASHAVTNNCATPTSPSTTNVAGTTAMANWVQSQCRVNYSIRISVHGLNSWTTTTTGVVTNYTFTNLSLSTTYDWQIQTWCNTSGSISSGWTAITTFTTLAQRVAGEEAPLQFNVYPNPANTQVMISFTTMEEGSYDLRLVDMFGRVVKNETDNAAAGDNIHVMNLDGTAKGVYIIELEKSGQVNKTRLIIQ